MVKRVGSKNVKKKKKSGFVYKKRSAEDVKRRAEQSGARFDSYIKSNFDMFRPKEGENQIRILPPTWDDADHYGFDVWLHRYIGGDNSSYLCLDKMQNKPCPICRESSRAKKAGEDDEAKELAPKKAVVAWVIDRDDDSMTPQLWAMSWSQDRDISDLCRLKKDGKVLMLDDPDEGFDVTIKRTGKGLKTRYQYIIDREPSPISEDQEEQETILEYIMENPIPETLMYHPAAKMEKCLSGMEEEIDDELDDESEDDEGTSHRSLKAAGRKRRRVEEDDEEDEDDEEEDDEEEEAPKKRGGKSKPAKRRKSDDDDDESDGDDDDDESDDDEEDDEEEEAPKKRGRKPAKKAPARKPANKPARKPAKKPAKKAGRKRR